MPPQSAEEEDRDFENVLRDRMPGVLQSSQRLQGVLGINRGTKMMDEMVMIPWILPEPPSLAKRERKGMQSKPTAGLPASTTGVDADVGHVSDEAVHGLEAPQLKKPSDVFCEAPPQIVLQPPPEESTQDQHVPMAAAPSQRKRHDFEPPTPGPLQSTTSAEPQSLLSDVPDSSSVDRPQPKTALRQSSLQSAFEPKQAVDAEHKSAPFTISDHPDAIGWEVASPPPLHKIPDRPLGPKIKHPLYWKSDLSRPIRDWLMAPVSQSVQINVSRLVFCDTQPRPKGSANKCSLSIDAQKYDKVKIFRLTLPYSTGAQAAEPLAPQPVLYNWFVIVVVSKGVTGDGVDSDSEQEEPKNEDDMPYWLMAFPAWQVTEVAGGQSRQAGRKL